MSIKIISKQTDTKERNISECSIGIFIDNSGSTCNVMSNKLTRFQNELKLESIFGNSAKIQYVVWSHEANKLTKISTSDGYTIPACIFENKTCCQIFDTSEVIIFTTDGEIDQKDVYKFSEKIQNSLNKLLVVCIQYCETMTSDISVFAPFLLAKNLLIMHNDGTTQKVMYSKGEIAKLYKKDQTLIVANFNKLKINDNFPEIPKNYILLSDDEKSIKVFNFEEFMKIKDFECKSLGDNDWDNICKMAKMNNLLTKLRDKVSELRNISVNTTIEYLKTTINTPALTLKNEIINNIMLLNTDAKDEKKLLERKAKLVKDLQEIIPKARLEEVEITKQLTVRLHDIKRYWEDVRKTLNHYESASYSLNDLVGLGNRAKRAKDISNDEEYETKPVIHDSKVPLIDCSIHLDKGPAVIWLNKPDDYTDTMNDHVLTFPLDCVPKLSGCIKSNPVCGECASGYLAYSKGLSLYRENIMGYIPCDIENNKQFVKRQLCKFLVDSKLLHHVEMLLLSIIDDNTSNWFELEVKEYIIDQLINNIKTTDTLAEEGKITTLKEAIMGLNSEKILRQPLIASLRLILFYLKYTTSTNNNTNSSSNIINISTSMSNTIASNLIHERMAYYLVELFNNLLLDNPNTYIEDYVHTLLYDTKCGIPVVKDINSVKLPLLKDLSKLFENWKFNKTIEMLQRLCKNLNIKDIKTINELISSAFISYTLISFKTLNNHERPLTIYNKLLNNKLFNTAVSLKHDSKENDEKTVKNITLNHLVAQYWQQDTDTLFVPAYACYLGQNSVPSKLFFNNKPLLKQDTKINADLIELTKKKLDETLRTTYGTAIPSAKSAHINLHKIVAQTIEDIYADNKSQIINIASNAPTDAMYVAVINKIKQTRGNKGNIYQYNLLRQVICCVNNFCQERKTFMEMKDWTFDKFDITFAYKLKKELEYLGVKNTINYNEVKVPKNILELVDEKELSQIIERLDKLLASISSQNNKSTETKVKNIKVAEVFQINIPEEQQNLDDWKKEQSEIISNIDYKDKIDISKIKIIAGMDISFDKNDVSHAVASLAFYKYPEIELISSISIKCSTNIKYMAGYLAFREAPILIKLLNIAKEHGNVPDLILMDGNGIWHPRACGIATHLSVLTGIPAFGVAKNVLLVENIDKEYVEKLMKNTKEHETKEIITQSNKILGVAYNVTGSYKSSTYVSTGSGVSLETAIIVTKKCSQHRVTEPIRHADLLSRELLANWN